MKPKKESKSSSVGKARRKAPSTIPFIVGMLDSSAHLDERAAARQKVEAVQSGAAAGQTIDLHGKSYEVIELPPNSYSLGITLSAQVLAGQAAELALKFAYESEQRNDAAPQIHWLDDLYSRLSARAKKAIEQDYARRKRRHAPALWSGRETAEAVFSSARDYSVRFRYATEEAQPDWRVQPVLLREAVASVLASLGHNVHWSSDSQKQRGE